MSRRLASTPYFVDQVLAAARKTEADNKRGAELKAALADELRCYHRNSSYPESDDTETRIAVDAILQVIREFGKPSPSPEQGERV